MLNPSPSYVIHTNILNIYLISIAYIKIKSTKSDPPPFKTTVHTPSNSNYFQFQQDIFKKSGHFRIRAQKTL